MTTTDRLSDRQAEEVFTSDRQRLIDLACRIVESRAVAEEIVQESWLRWCVRDYRQADARPIFYRIVSNLAKDWRRNRTAEYRALTDIYAVPTYEPSTETAVIARNELRLVVDTLMCMSDIHVKAFRLRTLYGRTYKQIGDDLGVSKSQSHKLIEQVMVRIGLALEP